MKKSIIITACALLCCFTAAGWGRKGHATVARIAETRLTKTTQKCISEIMHGESICGYASYADEHKNKLLVDYGFDPVDAKRVAALPHTFEANMDFEPFRGINDNGRYVKNCIHFIEQYSEDLRNWKELDDSTAFTELVLIVHFLGDMHCPEHIRYNPEDMTIGYYNVTFRKEVIRYHTIWDNNIIEQTNPWSFGDLARNFDSATPAEEAEIVKGGPYEWGRDAAKCSWPAHQVKPGDVLTMDWYFAQQPLMRSQLRKAGYRLAKQLNMIFDPSYARKHKKD
ncbi:MAG: S1/P1 nuclease [Bacteroidales bacterium]|nr:S1/P1 nuclease [Bacteroidales bacterium]